MPSQLKKHSYSASCHSYIRSQENLVKGEPGEQKFIRSPTRWHGYLGGNVCLRAKEMRGQCGAQARAAPGEGIHLDGHCPEPGPHFFLHWHTSLHSVAWSRATRLPLLLPEHSNTIPTSGLLRLLFPFPGTSFPSPDPSLGLSHHPGFSSKVLSGRLYLWWPHLTWH